MFNLIKAQNYQLKRDNFMIYVILFSLAYTALITYFGINEGIKSGEMNGGLFLASNGQAYSMLYLFPVLGFTSRICGWDFNDKTINYEVLAGHKRSDIFLSRTLVTFLWVFVGALAMTILPIGVITIIYGWGVNMSFGAALARFALCFLVLLRTTCCFICMTFLARNCFITLIFGYLLYEVEMMAYTLVNELTKNIEITWQLAASNLMELLDFSNYELGYVDGEDVVHFITDMEPSFLIGTIVISLVLSAVYLLLGYTVFRRSDIR